MCMQDIAVNMSVTALYSTLATGSGGGRTRVKANPSRLWCTVYDTMLTNIVPFFVRDPRSNVLIPLRSVGSPSFQETVPDTQRYPGIFNEELWVADPGNDLTLVEYVYDTTISLTAQAVRAEMGP